MQDVLAYVWIVGERHCLSKLNMMLVVDICFFLSGWRCSLLLDVCWEFLKNHGQMLNFVKCFFSSYCHDFMFFFSCFTFNMMGCIDFLNVELAFAFLVKTLLILMCYCFYKVFQFVGVIFRILTFIFMNNIDLLKK